MSRTILRRISSGLRLALGLGAVALACGPAHAALTDISETPLLTASGTLIKPNLLLILDDSGSMAEHYMPESASNFSPSSSTSQPTVYGFQASQCNGMAYNYAVTYAPPVDYTGTALPNASTTWLSGSASVSSLSTVNSVSSPSPVTIQSSGSLSLTFAGSGLSTSTYSTSSVVSVYDSSSTSKYGNYMQGTVTSWTKSGSNYVMVMNVTYASTTGTLSTPKLGVGLITSSNASNSSNGGTTIFNYYYKYSGTQPVLGYTYTVSGSTLSLTTTSTFYKECKSSIGSSPGSTVFTRVNVSSSATEAQNFANWAAYYSYRIMMMQTLVGQAFSGLSSDYRVGYTHIEYSYGSTPSATDFVGVSDFTSGVGGQKQLFWTALNAATPGGSTPMRGALSRAGQYFSHSKIVPPKSVDPIQYSCQRNYALIATDGGWNNQGETSTYGPFGLDNVTAVGEQDFTAARPMFDNATKADGTGGSASALSDVAMYYYSTPLRSTALGNCTGVAVAGVQNNVCDPNGPVPATPTDPATWQHLNTYAINLGQSGTLNYDANYQTETAGDFYNLKQGTKNWPIPSVTAGDATDVDDLWHTTVDGRGQYFDVADPVAVSNGLKQTLAAIQEVNASGSAAATSTLRPVAGNNQIFVASYTSALWIGDVRAYTINTTTGAPQITDSNGNDLATWSAATQLSSRATARTIYYNSGSGLKAFNISNINATSDATRNAYFLNVCAGTTPKLSQCPSLSTTNQTAANLSANMISYLSGTEQTAYYRPRVDKNNATHILGDMVGSSPAYVATNSPLLYSDSGFSVYQAGLTTLNRKPTVYVGGNDGMLHAYDAATGNELWAFIPNSVMPNMYKLADTNYANSHQYFVDGSPTVSDVMTDIGDGKGAQWRTILVGGLGAGGAAYYVLDITNPNSPILLWEFTNANLGDTYSPPLITKRANGTWVVVVTSGYNNVGDGNGHLFVLDAGKGTKLVDIPTYTSGTTPAGTAGTPSGLGQVNGWVDDPTNNTASRYYAGDLLGNLWRFDIDGITAPANAAMLLAQLNYHPTTGAPVPQPITTQPQLATVNYKGYSTSVVYVGTGEFLGISDLSNTAVQSIYAIKDKLATTGIGDPRATGGTMVQLTASNANNANSSGARTVSVGAVDWTSNSGWFVDLPDTGERINVNMILQFNVLTAASNVPLAAAPCTSGGGYSWLYTLDIGGGGGAASYISGSMIVGLSPFLLSNGKNGVIVNQSLKPPSAIVETTPATPAATGKRSSWRELIDR